MRMSKGQRPKEVNEGIAQVGGSQRDPFNDAAGLGCAGDTGATPAHEHHHHDRYTHLHHSDPEMTSVDPARPSAMAVVVHQPGTKRFVRWPVHDGLQTITPAPASTKFSARALTPASSATSRRPGPRRVRPGRPPRPADDISILHREASSVCHSPATAALQVRTSVVRRPLRRGRPTSSGSALVGDLPARYLYATSRRMTTSRGVLRGFFIVARRSLIRTSRQSLRRDRGDVHATDSSPRMDAQPIEDKRACSWIDSMSISASVSLTTSCSSRLLIPSIRIHDYPHEFVPYVTGEFIKRDVVDVGEDLLHDAPGHWSYHRADRPA